jgi:hypothetical protein
MRSAFTELGCLRVAAHRCAALFWLTASLDVDMQEMLNLPAPPEAAPVVRHSAFSGTVHVRSQFKTAM